MTHDLRPYPEYKESRLPWLGQIPAHWEVRRNGRLFAQRNETGFPELPILEVSLKTGVRVRDFENSARKQVMSDRGKYKRAAQGDIAYNMMRMWQGAVGMAPVDGLVSPAYVVARPYPEAEPRYYAYLFRTEAYMKEVNKYSHGIVSDRNRMYWDEFKQMPSAFPPRDEQQAIADFLDADGRRVRQFIRKKRRLIEVLNEQKQAIINRAVTRGLDLSSNLKPSGIDFLGDVPEHWEMKRLKSVARIRYGLGQPPRESPSGVPFIRATNVDHGRILTKDLLRVDLKDVPMSRDAILHENDIIVVRSGAYTADSAIVPPEYDGAVAGYDMVVTAKTVEAPFLALSLLNHYILSCQLYLLRSRAAQPHLNAEELGETLILIPPRPEQRGIVDFARRACEPIEWAVERIRRQVDLIQEYRGRLISDVVAGKFDVHHLTSISTEGSSAEIELMDNGREFFEDESQDADDLEPVEEAVDGD